MHTCTKNPKKITIASDGKATQKKTEAQQHSTARRQGRQHNNGKEESKKWSANPRRRRFHSSTVVDDVWFLTLRDKSSIKWNAREGILQAIAVDFSESGLLILL